MDRGGANMVLAVAAQKNMKPYLGLGREHSEDDSPFGSDLLSRKRPGPREEDRSGTRSFSEADSWAREAVAKAKKDIEAEMEGYPLRPGAPAVHEARTRVEPREAPRDSNDHRFSPGDLTSACGSYHHLNGETDSVVKNRQIMMSGHAIFSPDADTMVRCEVPP